MKRQDHGEVVFPSLERRGGCAIKKWPRSKAAQPGWSVPRDVPCERPPRLRPLWWLRIFFIAGPAAPPHLGGALYKTSLAGFRTSPIRIRRSPMSNSHVQPAKAIAEDIAHLCCVPDDWRSQISNLAASPLPTFCAKPLGGEFFLAEYATLRAECWELSYWHCCC